MVGNLNNLFTGLWPLIRWRNWSSTYEWLANGIPHTCAIIGQRENESVRQPSGTPKWSSAFDVPASCRIPPALIPALPPAPLSTLFYPYYFFRDLKGLAEAQWDCASGLTFITAAYPKFTGGQFRTTRLHGKTGSHLGFTAEKPATFREVPRWSFFFLFFLFFLCCG